MKIRIYSPEFPFPVTEGAFQVIADQARSIAALGHDVELVTWLGTRQPANLPIKGVRHIRWDSETGWFRSAVGRIVRSALTAKASPELHYYPPECDRRSELRSADLGIYHYSFAHSWLSAFRGPERRIAVHFHNLEHELFKDRSASARDPIRRVIHARNSRLLREHESVLERLVDEIWFLSPEDKAAFQSTGGQITGQALCRLVAPTYERAEFRKRAYERRSGPIHLGFIGKLDFGPNASSLDWILDEVCPRLASGGFTGELQIAGKGVSCSQLEKASRFEFVRLLGFVEDLESFWQELDLSLVPHQTGSGVRIKLLESIARGIPVLANSAAVRRIDPTLQAWSGLWSLDSAQEWAALILEKETKIRSLRADAIPFPESLLGEYTYSSLLSDNNESRGAN